MSQHPTTPLAETQIGHSSHDVIEIVLVEPDGLPAKVRVVGRSIQASSTPKTSPTQQPRSRNCSPGLMWCWPA
jgi:hypothetical protein